MPTFTRQTGRVFLFYIYKIVCYIFNVSLINYNPTKRKNGLHIRSATHQGSCTSRFLNITIIHKYNYGHVSKDYSKDQ